MFAIGLCGLAHAIAMTPVDVITCKVDFIRSNNFVGCKP